MKLPILLILYLMIIAPLHAQQSPSGRISPLVPTVTAVPRAVGRTVKNMFTFKEKNLAIAQWINVAAVIADNWSTWDGEKRCAACTEKNALGIKHLGRLTTGEMALQTGALAFFETTTDQYAAEQIMHDRNVYWRQMQYLLPTFFSVGHFMAMRHNLLIPTDPPAAVVNGLVTYKPATNAK